MAGSESVQKTKILESNPAFLIFFALYTAVAIFLLLLGLGSAFAALFPPVHDILEAWGRNADLVGLLARAMSQSAHLSESTLEILFDYLLSALNLAIGVFLVWRRPSDWVVRLLGLGMVGTAMVFNFQAHGVMGVVTRGVPALSYLNGLHLMMHATSGAAYVHALLLFPNGRLVPRRSIWLLGAIYLVMAAEIIVTLLRAGQGSGITFAIVTLLFGPSARDLDLLVPLIRHAELVFFVLFFGLLIPTVGVISQWYRYRAVSTPSEREQTKLVVWALGLAFVAGVIFLLLFIGPNLLQQAGLTDESLEQIEELTFRVIPPLFAIIPIALFIAILRHRLFDMDLVINRTLVYGPLTAILAGLFAALIRIVQSLFVAMTGEKSDAAIVITTLIVTAAFQPIRARLQTMVDRYFKQVPEK